MLKRELRRGMKKDLKKEFKKGFKTVGYTVESRRSPREFDNFTIVHLSDLHGEVYGRQNCELIRKIHAAKPDIVVMTGDMAEHGNRSCALVADLCGRLVRRYPVYYIFGNHEQCMERDERERFLKKLRALGVIVPENSWHSISRGGAYVKLYGLVMPMAYYKDPTRDDYVRGICFSAEDTGSFLGEADPSCFTILLCHNPLYFPSYRDWGADLTLSGHIHGGIIRLPGLGGVLSPDVTLFPRYDGGHFAERGKHLVVSRGLGNHFLVRIMNPPELVTVTLKGGQQKVAGRTARGIF